MNRIRLTAFFLSVAIAAFTLSYMTPSYAGKKCNEDSTHPSCGNDDPTSGIKYFDVTITEDIDGGGVDWRQTSGQSEVSYKDFWEDSSTGMLINLSYFRGLWPVDGAKCFPDGIFPRDMHAALIKKARKGSAKAHIWFWGFTTAGDLVPYILTLTGSFTISSDFPPPAEEVSTMQMTHWKMGLSNQGQDMKAISCIGENVKGSGFSVDMTVTAK